MARLMLLLLVVASMILISCAGTGQNGYTLKVTNGGKKYNERISVDVKKGLEMYNLTRASSGRDAGSIFYDFKKNFMMIRLPKARSCIFKNWIGDVPRPAAVQKVLKLLRKRAKIKLTTKSVEKLKVVGELKDRSILSKEMADLCANLTIYRVTEGDMNQNDMDQMDEADEESDMTKERAKRAGCKVSYSETCWKECRTCCFLIWCNTCCSKKCIYVANKVCD